MFFKLIYILLFVFATLTSCENNKYPSFLVEAEREIDINPKNALHILDSVNTYIKKEPKSSQFFYDLLCVKAKDKNDKPLTKSDLAMMVRVVNFYKKHKTEGYLCEAYYYMGRTYLSLNDYPNALDCYQQAEINLPHKGAYEFKTRLYGQMADLFYLQDLIKEAKYYILLSIDYAKMFGDKKYEINNILVLADIYSQENENDSCIHYLQKAIIKARSISNDTLENQINYVLATHYYNNNLYNKASEILQKIDTSCIYQDEKDGFYLTQGNAFYALDRYDEAFKCYQKVLQGGNAWAKEAALYMLTDIYRQRGDIEQALECTGRYIQVRDTVNKLNSNALVKKMDAIYNTNKIKNELLQQKTVSQSYSIVALALLSALLGLCLAFVLFRQHIYKKMEAIKKHYLQEIEQLSSRHKRLENRHIAEVKALTEKLNHTQKMISTLSAQLNEKQALLAKIKKEEAQQTKTNKQIIEAILSTPLLIELRKRLADKTNDHCHPSENEWTEITKKVEKAFPHFSEGIFPGHGISTYEYRVCILMKLNFSTTDIGRLTDKAQNTISMTKKRLAYKLLGAEATIEQLGKYIAML